MEKKPKEQCSPSSLAKEISSHPLFSILATSSLLLLLYSPHLLPLLCSPVLISTSLLLTTLLHLGSPVPSEEPSRVEEDPTEEEEEAVGPEDRMHYVLHYAQKAGSCESSAEWGRRGGPLEVIYEDFEGEEDDKNGDGNESEEDYYKGPPRRPGFMGFYDSDGDRSVDSSCSSSSAAEEEQMMFQWEEEEGDGMIEITLEEDNLIEIDLRTCR